MKKYLSIFAVSILSTILIFCQSDTNSLARTKFEKYLLIIHNFLDTTGWGDTTFFQNASKVKEAQVNLITITGIKRVLDTTEIGGLHCMLSEDDYLNWLNWYKKNKEKLRWNADSNRIYIEE